MMPTHVALLRAVNVGGRKVIMAELRSLAESLGWGAVETFIASGNLLYTPGNAARTAADDAARLETAMRAAWGMDVPALVLSGDALRAALATCPVPDAPGNRIHAMFCWSDPVIDMAAYAALRTPSETVTARGRTVWLHTPDGMGQSVLAAKLHKVITGTAVTGRNLNTVRAIAGRLS